MNSSYLDINNLQHLEKIAMQKASSLLGKDDTIYVDENNWFGDLYNRFNQSRIRQLFIVFKVKKERWLFILRKTALTFTIIHNNVRNVYLFDVNQKQLFSKGIKLQKDRIKQLKQQLNLGLRRLNIQDCDVYIEKGPT